MTMPVYNGRAPVGLATDNQEIINPVKAFRLAHNLSIAQLALAARVSDNTVARTEQGLYVRIPPRLLSLLIHRTVAYERVSYEDASHLLAVAYSSYRTARRVATGEEFPGLKTYGGSTLSENPLGWYFEAAGFTSKIEICKALCIHQATLLRHLNTPWLTTKISEEILEALRDAGVPLETLEALETAYRSYLGR